MHIALLFIAISLIVINYSFYQSMSKCTKKFGYNIVVTIPKNHNSRPRENLEEIHVILIKKIIAKLVLINNAPIMLNQ